MLSTLSYSTFCTSLIYHQFLIADSGLKNEPTLGGGLDQRSRVPEKKTTPENKIIAMAKGTKSVSKEHRPGAVARPSVRSDGPRARMAKRSNEPGEREKSEKNFDCL
jgi:hypothetical protein